MKGMTPLVAHGILVQLRHDQMSQERHSDRVGILIKNDWQQKAIVSPVRAGVSLKACTDFQTRTNRSTEN